MDRRHFIKLGIAGATVAVGGMLAGCAGGAAFRNASAAPGRNAVDERRY